MNKNFNIFPAESMTRDQSMIYIINFFNSRMSAMNTAQRNKVKELIGLHEISAPELVNKYIELVQNNA